MEKKIENIREILESNYNKYCKIDFIYNDPISIPHIFSQKEDIEIIAFLVATIAWGNRKMILKNGKNIVNLLEKKPYDFIINSSESDLKSLNKFVHRTFNGEDLIYFIKSLKNIYKNYSGLEEILTKSNNMYENFKTLYDIFFPNDIEPTRTRRQLANVSKGSAAKRLNMFMRWMVRKDDRKVDFGIWRNFSPANLFMPLDVHSGRVSRQLGLLSIKYNNWNAAVELTENLKQFDKNDPVKYDFALFGIGVNNK